MEQRNEVDTAPKINAILMKIQIAGKMNID